MLGWKYKLQLGRVKKRNEGLEDWSPHIFKRGGQKASAQEKHRARARSQVLQEKHQELQRSPRQQRLHLYEQRPTKGNTHKKVESRKARRAPEVPQQDQQQGRVKNNVLKMMMGNGGLRPVMVPHHVNWAYPRVGSHQARCRTPCHVLEARLRAQRYHLWRHHQASIAAAAANAMSASMHRQPRSTAKNVGKSKIPVLKSKVQKQDASSVPLGTDVMTLAGKNIAVTTSKSSRSKSWSGPINEDEICVVNSCFRYGMHTVSMGSGGGVRARVRARSSSPIGRLSDDALLTTVNYNTDPDTQPTSLDRNIVNITIPESISGRRFDKRSPRKDRKIIDGSATWAGERDPHRVNMFVSRAKHSMVNLAHHQSQPELYYESRWDILHRPSHLSDLPNNIDGTWSRLSNSETSWELPRAKMKSTSENRLSSVENKDILHNNKEQNVKYLNKEKEKNLLNEKSFIRKPINFHNKDQVMKNSKGSSDIEDAFDADSLGSGSLNDIRSGNNSESDNDDSGSADNLFKNLIGSTRSPPLNNKRTVNFMVDEFITDGELSSLENHKDENYVSMDDKSDENIDKLDEHESDEGFDTCDDSEPGISRRHSPRLSEEDFDSLSPEVDDQSQSCCSTIFSKEKSLKTHLNMTGCEMFIQGNLDDAFDQLYKELTEEGSEQLENKGQIGRKEPNTNTSLKMSPVSHLKSSQVKGHSKSANINKQIDDFNIKYREYLRLAQLKRETHRESCECGSPTSDLTADGSNLSLEYDAVCQDYGIPSLTITPTTIFIPETQTAKPVALPNLNLKHNKPENSEEIATASSQEFCAPVGLATTTKIWLPGSQEKLSPTVKYVLETVEAGLTTPSNPVSPLNSPTLTARCKGPKSPLVNKSPRLQQSQQHPHQQEEEQKQSIGLLNIEKQINSGHNHSLRLIDLQLPERCTSLGNSGHQQQPQQSTNCSLSGSSETFAVTGELHQSMTNGDEQQMQQCGGHHIDGDEPHVTTDDNHLAAITTHENQTSLTLIGQTEAATDAASVAAYNLSDGRYGVDNSSKCTEDNQSGLSIHDVHWEFRFPTPPLPPLISPPASLGMALHDGRSETPEIMPLTPTISSPLDSPIDNEKVIMFDYQEDSDNDCMLGNYSKNSITLSEKSYIQNVDDKEYTETAEGSKLPTPIDTPVSRDTGSTNSKINKFISETIGKSVSIAEDSEDSSEGVDPFNPTLSSYISAFNMNVSTEKKLVQPKGQQILKSLSLINGLHTTGQSKRQLPTVPPQQKVLGGSRIKAAIHNLKNAPSPTPSSDQHSRLSPQTVSSVRNVIKFWNSKVVSGNRSVSPVVSETMSEKIIAVPTFSDKMASFKAASSTYLPGRSSVNIDTENSSSAVKMMINETKANELSNNTRVKSYNMDIPNANVKYEKDLKRTNNGPGSKIPILKTNNVNIDTKIHQKSQFMNNKQQSREETKSIIVSDKGTEAVALQNKEYKQSPLLSYPRPYKPKESVMTIHHNKEEASTHKRNVPKENRKEHNFNAKEISTLELPNYTVHQVKLYGIFICI